MDKAELLKRIETDTLTPGGQPGYRQAIAAIKDVEAIRKMKDLDKKVAALATAELLAVVGEYRRTLRVKKMGRKKHTRG